LFTPHTNGGAMTIPSGAVFSQTERSFIQNAHKVYESETAGSANTAYANYHITDQGSAQISPNQKVGAYTTTVNASITLD